MALPCRRVDCLSPEAIQQLVGCTVVVSGTVARIIANHHTKAQAPNRQHQIVLMPATLGGVAFDHLCVACCNELTADRFIAGDVIELEAKCCVYEWRGARKVGVKRLRNARLTSKAPIII